MVLLVKVGDSVEMDSRRLALVRSIIDDPKECQGRPVPTPESLVGKNAGPTGSVLMIDANQVWKYVRVKPPVFNLETRIRRYDTRY